METVLSQFYNNEAMREAVHEYLIGSLKLLAIEKAFRGNDVKGIPEAKDAIDEAFVQLKASFGKSPKPRVENRAR